MRIRMRHLFLAGLCIAPLAQGADIPGSCLVTFNVKDKAFTTGVTTMSCVALEKRRVQLFQSINALPPASTVNGAEYAERLAIVEAALKKAEADTNWVALSLSISGNFLATLGLSACLETAGGGCAAAAIGKAISLASIAESAVSDSKKLQQSAALRTELAAIRGKIAALSGPADKLRAQLVTDFTGMCADVRQYCR